MTFSYKAEEPAPPPSGGSTPQGTGTPGKRSRSEVARLAALARWGKYKGKGKKPAPKKGRKPAQTPEAKEAQRRQEAQANRADVLNSFGSFGRDTLPDLEAMAAGGEPSDPDGMIMSGLAEKLENGTVVLTSEGKKLYNAASKGDRAAAKEAIAKAESNVMERQGKDKAKADKEDADKEKEAAPKAGGGGGGSSKPTDEEKEAQRKEKADKKKQATRDDIKEKMASGDVGLSPRGFDAFTEFADGGAMDSALAAGFREMGVVEGDPPRLTEAGRSLRNAIDRGDLRGAVDAVERGKSKKAGDDERAKARSEKEAAALERAKERDAEKKKREEEKRGPRRPMRDGIRINKGTKVMDLADIIHSLLDAAESLESDSATKAGKRHSASDTALIQAIYDAACGVCEMAVSLGAVEEMGEMGEMGEYITSEVEPMTVKTVGDELVYAGDEVKAIGDGWTQGYLVRFGGEGDLTTYRDVFTRETDYGSAKSSDVYVHHRQLPGIGKQQLRNPAQLNLDDVGVFIKHLLDMRDPYERMLYGLAQQGKLGWSSGTAPHLVERKALEDGRHVIEKWPLGLDASYTPTPAGGLEMTTAALKALAELPPAFLDETDEGDLSAIDADPEATKAQAEIEDRADPPAEISMDPDRERLLTLRLRHLRIKELA